MRKLAVITGGSGGLGKAIAARLSEAGWRVEAPGSTELDVRDASAIAAYFQNKTIDLLVCAAGLTLDTPLMKMTEAAWDETLRVNFTGARLCAAAALPAMRDRRKGHIVFISSRSANHPPAGQAAYAAAKAALLGLTEDLASRHGRENIRVNAILPGFLETRMTETVSRARRDEILRAHALGRFNTPEMVADFIHHLQERLPHTSGQTFQLDSRIP